MGTVLIHSGMPKTGSTSIQTWLRRHATHLREVAPHLSPPRDRDGRRTFPLRSRRSADERQHGLVRHAVLRHPSTAGRGSRAHGTRRRLRRRARPRRIGCRQRALERRDLLDPLPRRRRAVPPQSRSPRATSYRARRLLRAAAAHRARGAVAAMGLPLGDEPERVGARPGSSAPLRRHRRSRPPARARHLVRRTTVPPRPARRRRRGRRLHTGIPEDRRCAGCREQQRESRALTRLRDPAPARRRR